MNEHLGSNAYPIVLNRNVPVAAFRAALQELTQARVPLYWARTQNDLGTALAVLGERER
jgi:hypothetical protein